MSKDKPVETAITEAAHAASRTTGRRATPKAENFAVESPSRADTPKRPEGYVER